MKFKSKLIIKNKSICNFLQRVWGVEVKSWWVWFVTRLWVGGGKRMWRVKRVWGGIKRVGGQARCFS